MYAYVAQFAPSLTLIRAKQGELPIYCFFMSNICLVAGRNGSKLQHTFHHYPVFLELSVKNTESCLQSRVSPPWRLSQKLAAGQRAVLLVAGYFTFIVFYKYVWRIQLWYVSHHILLDDIFIWNKNDNHYNTNYSIVVVLLANK